MAWFRWFRHVIMAGRLPYIFFLGFNVLMLVMRTDMLFNTNTHARPTWLRSMAYTTYGWLAICVYVCVCAHTIVCMVACTVLLSDRITHLSFSFSFASSLVRMHVCSFTAIMATSNDNPLNLSYLLNVGPEFRLQMDKHFYQLSHVANQFQFK